MGFKAISGGGGSGAEGGFKVTTACVLQEGAAAPLTETG